MSTPGTGAPAPPAGMAAGAARGRGRGVRGGAVRGAAGRGMRGGRGSPMPVRRAPQRGRAGPIGGRGGGRGLRVQIPSDTSGSPGTSPTQQAAPRSPTGDAPPPNAPRPAPGLQRAVSSPVSGVHGAATGSAGFTTPVGGKAPKLSKAQSFAVPNGGTQTDAKSRSTVLMQGWLEKKGSKRWFQLTADELSWNMKAGTEQIGALPLARTRFVLGPKKFQFTLTTAQKTYILTAKGEQLHTQWTTALQKAIESANAHQQQLLMEAVTKTHRKHGGIRHNGSKAFLVLDDVRLLRFSSLAEAKARKPPKFVLHLSGCKVMENAHGKPLFYIVTHLDVKQKTPYEFGCATKQSTMEWVEAITGAIAKANAAGPVKAVNKDVTVGSGVGLFDDCNDDDDEFGDGDSSTAAATSAMPELAELTKNGFLDKKGSQRWFLFNGEKLSWSTQPTTTDFIGTMNLAVTEIEMGPKPTQFTCKTPAKNYILTAKTAAEAQSWFDVLQLGRARGAERRKQSLQKALSNRVLLHQGFLNLKKARRYFLLQNETLSCYASAEDCKNTGLPANKGLWDLYGASVVEEVHAQPLLYVDFHDGSRIELAADSKAEASVWATKITAGIQRAQKRGPKEVGKLSKSERRQALEEQEQKAARERQKAEEEAAARRQEKRVMDAVRKQRDVVIDALCKDIDFTGTDHLNQHAIFMALGNAYLQDELVRAMVRVCVQNSCHNTFLDVVMSTEIESCSIETTLFRTDSLATKTAGAFLKLTAGDYLRETLGPLVQSILADPVGFEVDPNKMSDTDDQTANMARLADAAGRALEAVTDSLPDVPPAVRAFLEQLKHRVEVKFPGARLKAVGALFALRFMQPAIFSPEGFGLLDAPPGREARRALILVAKILQNLANGVQFGQKEEFMAPMNAFVMEHVQELFAWFDEISSTHGAAADAEYRSAGMAEGALDPTAADAALTTVMLALLKHRERVVTELQKRGADQSPHWLAITALLDSVKQ